MIQLPRRSVTRFFIPLIDVLTLLFCIFLMMPLVKNIGPASGAEEAEAGADQIRRLQLEIDRLRNQGHELPEALQAELERLRKERTQNLQDRLAVRVLEIDPKTGGLYYLDPDRIDITTPGQAQKLIDHDRERQKDGKRELFYLILYPRDPKSVFPQVDQRRDYDGWFKDVAHGFDIPGVAPSKAGQP
jgi:hypothetical protein